MKDLFASLFEFGGSFMAEAADDLYDYAYVQIGFITLALILFSVLFYYKVLDKPRFHRWWHWLFVLIANCILMFAIAWLYTSGVFIREGLYDYVFFDYLNFLIAVFIYAGVFFFLFSLIVKRFSVNRRKTPF